MAEVLTDERVAGVLRPFVRATAPVLQAMRESDPLGLRTRFGADNDVDPDSVDPDSVEHGPAEPDTTDVLEPEEKASPKQLAELGGTDAPAKAGAVQKLMRQLDGMQLPGSSTWDEMTVEQRCDWWARRVGRFLALLAGLPRFGGAITSRLPIRNALGVAGQGLVLCAIAAEHGVTDQTLQVRLIAKVLLERELSTEVASGRSGGSQIEDDARTAELTEDLDESRRKHGRPTPKAVARTVWRMARALWEMNAELDKRPQGRFYHELIGSVPVVGVVGGYLGERSALRTVARRGAKWISHNRGSVE